LRSRGPMGLLAQDPQDAPPSTHVGPAPTVKITFTARADRRASHGSHRRAEIQGSSESLQVPLPGRRQSRRVPLIRDLRTPSRGRTKTPLSLVKIAVEARRALTAPSVATRCCSLPTKSLTKRKWRASVVDAAIYDDAGHAISTLEQPAFAVRENDETAEDRSLYERVASKHGRTPRGQQSEHGLDACQPFSRWHISSPKISVNATR
jgi:hypothetical protein